MFRKTPVPQTGINIITRIIRFTSFNAVFFGICNRTILKKPIDKAMAPMSKGINVE